MNIYVPVKLGTTFPSNPLRSQKEHLTRASHSCSKAGGQAYRIRGPHKFMEEVKAETLFDKRQ